MVASGRSPWTTTCVVSAAQLPIGESADSVVDVTGAESFRQRMYTAADIRSYLERFGMPELLNDVVLREGEEFVPRALPDRRWRRDRWLTRKVVNDRGGLEHVASARERDLGCMINARRAALRHGWAYVEGYAIRRDDPEGLQFHCWNADSEGLIDTTWVDPGIAYFGVSVPVRRMAEAYLSNPLLPVLTAVTW